MEEMRNLLNESNSSPAMFRSTLLNQDQALNSIKFFVRARIEEKEGKSRQRNWPMLAEFLGPQIIQGNSKSIFLFGACNRLSTEQMNSLIDMAEDASKTFVNVRNNSVPLMASNIFQLKEDINNLQVMVNQIEFMIKERKGSLKKEEAGIVSEFKRRVSKKNRVLEAQETVDDVDIAQQSIEKLRLQNQLANLQQNLLSKQSVQSFVNLHGPIDHRMSRRLTSMRCPGGAEQLQDAIG